MTSLEDQMEVSVLDEEDSEGSEEGNELVGSNYEASEGSGSTVGLGRREGVLREQEEEGGAERENADGDENGVDEGAEDDAQDGDGVPDHVPE